MPNFTIYIYSYTGMNWTLKDDENDDDDTTTPPTPTTTTQPPHTTGITDDETISAATFMFDGENFLLTSPMNVPRYGHSCSLMADGWVMVAAGSDEFRDVYGDDKFSVEIYSPITDSWSTGVSLPVGDYQFVPGLVQDGQDMLHLGSWREEEGEGSIYRLSEGAEAWQLEEKRITATHWGGSAIKFQQDNIFC